MVKSIVCYFNNIENNNTKEKIVLKFHEVLFNICVFDNDKSRETNQAGHIIKMVTVLDSNN